MIDAAFLELPRRREPRGPCTNHDGVEMFVFCHPKRSCLVILSEAKDLLFRCHPEHSEGSAVAVSCAARSGAGPLRGTRTMLPCSYGKTAILPTKPDIRGAGSPVIVPRSDPAPAIHAH